MVQSGGEVGREAFYENLFLGVGAGNRRRVARINGRFYGKGLYHGVDACLQGACERVPLAEIGKVDEAVGLKDMGMICAENHGSGGHDVSDGRAVGVGRHDPNMDGDFVRGVFVHNWNGASQCNQTLRQGAVRFEI